MLTDIYDNPLSTGSPTAQARFNDALREIRTFHGDPIATLDAALEHDPDFGLAWITRAIVLAQITDRMFDTEVQRSLRAASACRLDDRERSHFSAALAWSEGRLHESTMAFARIAADSPRDALAVQNAHAGCFFTGNQFDLRDIPLAALRAHPDGEARHAILGMAAFGFEECGDYARADAMGARRSRSNQRMRGRPTPLLTSTRCAAISPAGGSGWRRHPADGRRIVALPITTGGISAFCASRRRTMSRP